MISPHRLHCLGLSLPEIAFACEISEEDAEAQIEAAKDRRQQAVEIAPIGRQLMTPLLARPDFIQSKFGKRLRA